MMQSIRTFVAGVRGLHPLWQVWLLIMMIVNGVLPFFYLAELAAIITLIGMFSGAFLGLVLVHLHGFTKLLGLMHLPWVPMIAAQIGLYPGFNSASNYSLWLTVAILITAISLVIDAIDVAAFFRTKKD